MNVSKEYPVVILTGPRQVGKTTMLQKLMEGSSRGYVTLDDLNERALAKVKFGKFPPISHKFLRKLLQKPLPNPSLLCIIKVHQGDHDPTAHARERRKQIQRRKGCFQ